MTTNTIPQTITTVLHSYSFDTRTPDGLAAWNALRAKLSGLGLQCFESHGGGSHFFSWVPADGLRVELETAHLFANQWNTAPIAGVSDKGYRVFDWAKDYESRIGAPRGIARGHYLEQTAEMQSVRHETAGCGYCGKQAPAGQSEFCPHCLDSEYLKMSELHLLRMRRIDEDVPHAQRAPLTDAERATLEPLYVAAQTHGVTERGKKRMRDARLSIEQKFTRVTTAAKDERDGLIWLLDHGINIDNVIYYSHTRRFCFGWRTPLAPEVKSALLDVVSEFPFDYDIKEGGK